VIRSRNLQRTFAINSVLIQSDNKICNQQLLSIVNKNNLYLKFNEQ